MYNPGLYYPGTDASSGHLDQNVSRLNDSINILNQTISSMASTMGTAARMGAGVAYQGAMTAGEMITPFRTPTLSQGPADPAFLNSLYHVDPGAAMTMAQGMSPAQMMGSMGVGYAPPSYSQVGFQAARHAMGGGDQFRPGREEFARQTEATAYNFFSKYIRPAVFMADVAFSVMNPLGYAQGAAQLSAGASDAMAGTDLAKWMYFDTYPDEIMGRLFGHGEAWSKGIKTVETESALMNTNLRVRNQAGDFQLYRDLEKTERREWARGLSGTFSGLASVALQNVEGLSPEDVASLRQMSSGRNFHDFFSDLIDPEVIRKTLGETSGSSRTEKIQKFEEMAEEVIAENADLLKALLHVRSKIGGSASDALRELENIRALVPDATTNMEALTRAKTRISRMSDALDMSQGQVVSFHSQMAQTYVNLGHDPSRGFSAAGQILDAIDTTGKTPREAIGKIQEATENMLHFERLVSSSPVIQRDLVTLAHAALEQGVKKITPEMIEQLLTMTPEEHRGHRSKIDDLMRDADRGDPEAQRELASVYRFLNDPENTITGEQYLRHLVSVGHLKTDDEFQSFIYKQFLDANYGPHEAAYRSEQLTKSWGPEAAQHVEQKRLRERLPASERMAITESSNDEIVADQEEKRRFEDLSVRELFTSGKAGGLEAAGEVWKRSGAAGAARTFVSTSASLSGLAWDATKDVVGDAASFTANAASFAANAASHVVLGRDLSAGDTRRRGSGDDSGLMLSVLKDIYSLDPRTAREIRKEIMANENSSSVHNATYDKELMDRVLVDIVKRAASGDSEGLSLKIAEKGFDERYDSASTGVLRLFDEVSSADIPEEEKRRRLAELGLLRRDMLTREGVGYDFEDVRVQRGVFESFGVEYDPEKDFMGPKDLEDLLYLFGKEKIIEIRRVAADRARRAADIKDGLLYFTGIEGMSEEEHAAFSAATTRFIQDPGLVDKEDLTNMLNFVAGGDLGGLIIDDEDETTVKDYLLQAISQDMGIQMKEGEEYATFLKRVAESSFGESGDSREATIQMIRILNDLGQKIREMQGEADPPTADDTDPSGAVDDVVAVDIVKTTAQTFDTLGQVLTGLFQRLNYSPSTLSDQNIGRMNR